LQEGAVGDERRFRAGRELAAREGPRRGREEGLVGIEQDGNVAAMVEVNCETDFVAKNPDFVEFVSSLARNVAKSKPASIEAFQAAQKDALAEKIAKIGENMTIRRYARAEGVLGTYNHMGGKIGVIIELETPTNNDTVKALARDIAMQVAASSPQWLKREEADAKTLDNERHVAREKAKADGKPEKILEKIVEGQVNKFLQENCLLEQAFVKDDKLTVQKHVEKVAKELGTTISVKAMHRFKVGEGIEKKADDFAAEVAKMAGGAH
jgi:elongation factor Ts